MHFISVIMTDFGSSLMLSRSEFLELVQINPERFQSLARRNLLPFARGERYQGSYPTGSWGKYSPMEAMMTIIAQDLVATARVSQGVAAQITHDSAMKIWSRWKELSKSVLNSDGSLLASGVFIGATWDAESPNKMETWCGTLPEVIDYLEHAGEISFVLSNVTKAGRLLSRRASRTGISLGDFW